MKRQNLQNRRGFSLLELVVVVAIMLAIAAYATPNILTSISDYRLKNTMTQVAGLYQQQRMQAVKQNVVLTSPNATTINGRTVVWYDTPSAATVTHTTGVYDSGEPMIVFPVNITIATSGAPTFDTSTLIGSNFSPQSQSTYKVSFNQRGLPCAGSPCVNYDGTNPPVCFLVYFKNNRSFGQTGWGAITITPGGRMRTWFYNGSTYVGL